MTILFSLLVTAAFGQSKTETIKHTEPVPAGEPVLVVANIDGNIDIQVYDGTEIKFTVEKTISGKSQAALDQGMKDIQVAFEVYGDTLVARLDHPCHNKEKRVQSDKIWKYYLSDCEWDPDYSHRLDFAVQVPANIALRASTINNGVIDVRGVRGDIEVDNINGDINLYSVGGGKLRVSSINGEVKVNCAVLPTRDSRLYALNGDINATFPDDLSAKVSFSTFNGEFFTEFDTELGVPELKETAKSGKKGTKYKVGGYPVMTIGGGKLNLEVETFNGDAYIRKSRAR